MATYEQLAVIMTDTSNRRIDLPLIDHHCHGVVDIELSDEEFRNRATASTGRARRYGTACVALRPGGAAFCGPGPQSQPLAPLDEYLAQRRDMGAAEANRLLLQAPAPPSTSLTRACRTRGYLTPRPWRRADARVREIVRIERVAEDLAAESTAVVFVAKFPETLAARSREAVGLKSIIAYRHGFDIPAERPSGREILDAANRWFRAAEKTGTFRITTRPAEVRAVVGHRTGLPIQLHTEYGDGDH